MEYIWIALAVILVLAAMVTTPSEFKNFFSWLGEKYHQVVDFFKNLFKK